MLRLFAERSARTDEARNSRREQGILLGSGLVGGEGLVGVAIAAIAFYLGRAPEGVGSAWAGAAAQWVALAAFALLAMWFWRTITWAGRRQGLGAGG
jgi:hypothetical protein